MLDKTFTVLCQKVRVLFLFFNQENTFEEKNKSTMRTPRVHLAYVQFSSVQCGMESPFYGKPTCAPFCLSGISLETVLMLVWLTMALSRPAKVNRWPFAIFFYASLLQAVDGVMSLTLCPQVVSQAPQRCRSSKTQDTCDGCSSPPV